MKGGYVFLSYEMYLSSILAAFVWCARYAANKPICGYGFYGTIVATWVFIDSVWGKNVHFIPNMWTSKWETNTTSHCSLSKVSTKSLHWSLAFLTSLPESISGQPMSVLLTYAIDRIVRSMQPFLFCSLLCLNGFYCTTNSRYFTVSLRQVPTTCVESLSI